MNRCVWENDSATAPLRNRWCVESLPVRFRALRWYWRHAPVRRGIVPLTYSFSRMLGWKARMKVSLPGFLTITCNLSNSQYHPLYTLGGLYESDTLRFILNSLEPGDVFCDVGCNWGFFSLLAALRVGERGKVVAFDPNPEVLKEGLRRHVEQSRLSNVLIECCAVSDDHNQPVELTFPGSGHSGEASIMRKRPPTITRRIFARTVRLDRFFSRDAFPRLIKLDVEGAEMKALCGSVEALRGGARPVFVIEYIPDTKTYSHRLEDILSFFKPYDYLLGWIVPCGVCKAHSSDPPPCVRDGNLCAIPSELVEFYSPVACVQQ